VKNEVLIKFRKSNNLTQQEMAKKLGVSLSLYQKVENGERNSSFNFINRFNIVFPNADIKSIFLTKNHTIRVGKPISKTLALRDSSLPGYRVQDSRILDK